MTATATIAPARPQHLEALSRANQVRLARAELKRRVACGEITASDVILESPWEADSMTVADLLMSQRRWGHQRCRRVLGQIPVSETKTIGSMTDRQRRALGVRATRVRCAARCVARVGGAIDVVAGACELLRRTVARALAPHCPERDQGPPTRPACSEPAAASRGRAHPVGRPLSRHPRPLGSRARRAAACSGPRRAVSDSRSQRLALLEQRLGDHVPEAGHGVAREHGAALAEAVQVRPRSLRASSSWSHWSTIAFSSVRSTSGTM